MPRIVVVGSLSLDRVVLLPVYPAEDAKLRSENNVVLECGGGNAGNTAWALGRFCGNGNGNGNGNGGKGNEKKNTVDTVEVFSKVGNDQVGQILRSHFNDDSGIVVGNGASPTTFIMVTPGGRTCVHTTGDVLPLSVEDTDKRREYFSLADHLHFDTRQTVAANHIAHAHLRPTTTVSIDCEKVRVIDGKSDYDFWSLCSSARVVFTSKNFPFIFQRGMSERPLNSLKRDKVNSTVINLFDSELSESERSVDDVRGAHDKMLRSTIFSKAEVIVTTRGSESIVVTGRDTKKNCFQVDAESVPVVDSTGAGDVFIAGFLYALTIRGVHDLRTCVRTGAAAAKAKLASMGARGESNWNQEEIDEYLLSDPSHSAVPV